MKRYFFNVTLMLDKLRLIIRSFQYSYSFDFKLIMKATFLQSCFCSSFKTNHICEETLKKTLEESLDSDLRFIQSLALFWLILHIF